MIPQDFELRLSCFVMHRTMVRDIANSFAERSLNDAAAQFDVRGPSAGAASSSSQQLLGC